MRGTNGCRGRLVAIGALLATGIVAGLASPAIASPSREAPTIVASENELNTAAEASRPAVRLSVPSVAVGLPPVPVNRSTCRSDLSGPTMTIVVPDLSYICPVYAGGQEVMDAGGVAFLQHPGVGSLLASGPGQPGTLWLAAHRTSHGGAFATVPDLEVGAIVVVADEAVTASYRVVARRLVQVRDDVVVDAAGRATEAATLETILRPDLGIDGAPRLLLQTCEGSSLRWMIYADLVDG